MILQVAKRIANISFGLTQTLVKEKNEVSA